MLINKRYQLMFQLAGLILLFSALMVSRSGFCDMVNADTYQQVKSRLKKSTTFLSCLKQFSVATRSTIEAVYFSGQKLQFDQAQFSVLMTGRDLKPEFNADEFVFKAPAEVRQVVFCGLKAVMLKLLSGDQRHLEPVTVPHFAYTTACHKSQVIGIII